MISAGNNAELRSKMNEMNALSHNLEIHSNNWHTQPALCNQPWLFCIKLEGCPAYFSLNTLHAECEAMLRM